VEEFREEVVKRVPADAGERVVEEIGPAGTRVVRTEAIPAPLTTEVVTTREAVAPGRVVRRRWWHRRPVARPDVVVTESYAAPVYELDPSLSQFLRVMWFLLGLLECVLALRFFLALFAANPRNEFAGLVYAITGPFAGPFRTLFPTPSASGSVFEVGTLFAMAAYFFVCWAFVRLIGVMTNRRVDV
jgi:uncharacterized protein YggT (Ycf19 family)